MSYVLLYTVKDSFLTWTISFLNLSVCVGSPRGYLLLVSFNTVRLATVLLGTFETCKTNQKIKSGYKV